MKLIVWSKENCPKCNLAKDFLKARGITYEERLIDGITWTKEQLLEVAPSARSVPQIIINDEWIGGYEQLLVYDFWI